MPSCVKLDTNCIRIFENNGKCPQCGADAYQKPDSDTVKKGSSLFFKYMGGRGFAAKSFLSRAARLENINALITLGDNYFKKCKYEKARKYYLIAAAQENSYAIYALGNLHTKLAEKVDKTHNLQQAAKYFQLAVTLGYNDAQFNLAQCYEKGLGVEQNSQQALGLYCRSAQNGNAEAQFKLASSNCWEVGTDESLMTAAHWYHAAAEKGNADAQCNLGYCYIQGKGVKKNETEAVRWYTLSAKQGNANAQYNLGICYENGRGVEKNESEAARWYTLAAKQGLVNAIEALKKRKINF